MIYDLPDNHCAVFQGNMLEYYIGEGWPVFSGTLDEFQEFYPQEFKQLLDLKIIKWKP